MVACFDLISIAESNVGLLVVEIDPSNVEALFSGAWDGSSISRSTDPTTWSNLSLRFRLGDDDRHGIISGSGISLWRNQVWYGINMV